MRVERLLWLLGSSAITAGGATLTLGAGVQQTADGGMPRSTRRASRQTTGRAWPGESSAWWTRLCGAGRTTGGRCGHGPGVSPPHHVKGFSRRPEQW